MKDGMQKYTDMCIIKTAAAKLDTTETKRKTERNLEKELEKLRNDIKEIKKSIMSKSKI